MNLYNKKQIEAIAEESGFIRDNIEKVIRLSDILSFVDSNPMLSGLLALKGGTAINLSLFSLPRLSVDIDFDFCGNYSREEMEAKRVSVTSELLSWMESQDMLLTLIPSILFLLIRGYLIIGTVEVTRIISK